MTRQRTGCPDCGCEEFEQNRVVAIFYDSLEDSAWIVDEVEEDGVVFCADCGLEISVSPNQRGSR